METRQRRSFTDDYKWQAVDLVGNFSEKSWKIIEGVKKVKPLLGFAALARILRMHVDTIGAAINLRRTGLDQLDQRLFESRRLDLGLQRDERFDGVGRGLLKVYAWLHGRSAFDLRER